MHMHTQTHTHTHTHTQHSFLLSCFFLLQTKRSEFPNVVFLAVNVMEGEEIAEQYALEALPTVLFLLPRNGLRVSAEQMVR